MISDEKETIAQVDRAAAEARARLDGTGRKSMLLVHEADRAQEQARLAAEIEGIDRVAANARRVLDRNKGRGAVAPVAEPSPAERGRQIAAEIIGTSGAPASRAPSDDEVARAFAVARAKLDGTPIPPAPTVVDAEREARIGAKVAARRARREAREVAEAAKKAPATPCARCETKIAEGDPERYCAKCATEDDYDGPEGDSRGDCKKCGKEIIGPVFCKAPHPKSDEEEARARHRPKAQQAPTSTVQRPPRIAGRLVPTRLLAPMAIDPVALRVVFGVWSRGMIEAAHLAKAKADWEARKAAGPRLAESGTLVDGAGGALRLFGDVGVIEVQGALVRHGDMLSDISGATSYDTIGAALDVAIASSSVRAILLHINTPGGECDGLNELATAIAASPKPVYAYADNLCASAGYWLAAQCKGIIAEQASESGSIGVRCAMVDHSAADEAEGIREIEIVSSQSPGKRSKPVTEDVIARAQTRLDDLAEIFVESVARGRRVSTRKVLDDFGKGDCLIASKAKAAGMIDRIGGFSDAIAFARR